MLSFKDFINESLEYLPKTGESEVVHHSSDKSFPSFNPLSHFGTANAARARAVSSGQSPKDSKHLYSARLNLGNVVNMGDDGENHTPHGILHSLHKAGHITVNNYLNMRNKMSAAENDESRKDMLVKYLKRRKIDTIRYKNRVEDPGSTSYIITHPKQVRILRKSFSPVNVSRGEEKLK